MKLSLLFLSGLAAALRTTSTKCKADNCARAITGTNRPVRSQIADCMSFQQCTVQPPPSTTTITTVITTNEPGYQPPSTPPETTATASTVCPSNVPSYASVCSGTQRYSSACSCAGQTRSYTTESALTVVAITTSYVITPDQPDQCTFGGGPGKADCGCSYQGACNRAYCGQSSLAVTAFDAEGCLQECDADYACQGFAFIEAGYYDSGCNLCYGAVTVEDLVNNNDQWGYRLSAPCTGVAGSLCSQPNY